MTKKPNITDEERAIFRDAMGQIKPRPPTPTIKLKKINAERITKPTLAFHSSPDVTGTDTLSFSAPGLQHKKFTQLKQGKCRIEATLDLHDHTRDAALIATDDFLTRCQRKNYRVVCIVHGKGLYSANAHPILKNLLNGYLRTHPLVLAFHSTQARHGGTGAVYVLIRSI